MRNEGKLRYAQGKPALAVEPLERAVSSAFIKGDQTLGRDAASDLVHVLVALYRHEGSARLTGEVGQASWPVKFRHPGRWTGQEACPTSEIMQRAAGLDRPT
jgi:hypothetical protein